MLWTFSLRNKDDSYVYAHLTYDWDKDIYHMTFNEDLPDGSPAVLNILAKRGIYEVEDGLCRAFIRDRVIPANRQNIGTILRKMGEKYYHECFMLKNIPMSVMDDAYIELESTVE